MCYKTPKEIRMNINYLSKIIFLLLLSMQLFGQDFYDISTINTIEITFTESNWDALLDNLVSEGNEERLLGTAVINGITYDSVGFRYKGNSSYSADQIKNPLNVKLNYIIDDQEHKNYGTLKLANVFKDPSFVRETLSYEIAQKYMPASKANYIKVYINNEYFGLYTSVQDVDKHFLRTNFSSGNNPFFKGELVYGSPQIVSTIWDYLGTDSSAYSDYYEIKSDYGWSDLIGFLDVLNNNTESVEDVLNVDRHLWMLAFSNLLVHLDGPINFGHNYYLYMDNAARFNPIVWDMNMNFGVFSFIIGGSPLNTTELQQLDPFLNMESSTYPIISKILNNDAYRRMYVAHMKTIMADYFENGLYRTRAIEIQDIIDSDVQGDPNKFYTYADFTNNIDNSIGGGSVRPGPENQSILGITELMEARVTYLNSLSDFQATSPTISELGRSPSHPSPNSTVWIKANVSDANLVQLAYRNSITDSFEKVEMLDDGNSEVGSVGDGVYGVSITTGSSGFQYYIYAENDNAASFLPERAAYQFYTLTVSGNLVINEFMASNEATVTDSIDEYDDWIELYNNTDSEISLNGYFLSDDGDETSKWTFPDTTISANGYLIIWADKDETQVGLHANFKLSSSGETIYLSNSDTTIIDEIYFTEQTTDFSTGRFPNGTGSFVQMSPSFGSENMDEVTSVENQLLEVPSNYSLSQNYPNPFNPSTQIVVSVPEGGMYFLRVYNVLGQEVATLLSDEINAGTHTFNFDASILTSGIYFYNFTGNNFTQTKKMVLVK